MVGEVGQDRNTSERSLGRQEDLQQESSTAGALYESQAAKWQHPKHGLGCSASQMLRR